MKAVSGTTSAVGYSNNVGTYVSTTNYFDVFPPAGYVIANTVAFVPSISQIHFAGVVNADDSLRCEWAYHNGTAIIASSSADRIRVWVQDTEQRATPVGNWFGIWGKN